MSCLTLSVKRKLFLGPLIGEYKVTAVLSLSLMIVTVMCLMNILFEI